VFIENGAIDSSPPQKSRLGKWVLTSILRWLLIGVVLGVVIVIPTVNSLSAVDTCTECEGMGYALAEAFSPAIGGLWGLAAGSIGAAVAVATRSRKVYSWTMASLASLPMATSVVGSFLGTQRLLHSLALTFLAGGVVWAIGWNMSRPLDPMPVT
jgi:hypothetical protein